MSDTPRTDAAVHPSKLLRRPDGTFREAVDAVFSRQLEHELAEAQAEIVRLKGEIDELRAALAEQKPMLEMNPQKREWVGLTGDEIEDLPKDKTWWEIIRAAEAKLREKNGG
jgi:hypothetical protein